MSILFHIVIINVIISEFIIDICITGTLSHLKNMSEYIMMFISEFVINSIRIADTRAHTLLHLKNMSEYIYIFISEFVIDILITGLGTHTLHLPVTPNISEYIFISELS